MLLLSSSACMWVQVFEWENVTLGLGCDPFRVRLSKVVGKRESGFDPCGVGWPGRLENHRCLKIR